MIFFVIIIFLIELLIFNTTQFTLWPEMVMYPWLANHGFLLYRDIVNPYFPLLTWILTGVTKIFGYDTRVFIYFTWGYVFITQLFFIFLVQKLYKNLKLTLLAFLLYAVTLLTFEGNSLWFDLICSLPLLLSFYFLHQRKYLLAGLFLGVGFLIKQTVIWVIILNIFYLRKTIKNTAQVVLPIFLLLLIISLYFFQQQIFADFYYWGIKMAFGGMQAHAEFLEWPTRRNLLIMAAVFSPLIIYSGEIIKDRVLKLTSLFFIATFLFVIPRFGYFHLAAALPFFAIIAAKIMLRKKIARTVYLFFVIILMVTMVLKRHPFSVRFFSAPTVQKGSSLEKYFMKKTLPKKPWKDAFPWYQDK